MDLKSRKIGERFEHLGTWLVKVSEDKVELAELAASAISPLPKLHPHECKSCGRKWESLKIIEICSCSSHRQPKPLGRANSPWRCKMCGWSNAEDSARCSSCNKRKQRQPRQPGPRSDAALPCILLACDTANKTGWSIYVGGLLQGHGEHALYNDKGMESTRNVIDTLYELRRVTSFPIVFVSERSWGGVMGMSRTMAFGYWVHALRTLGVPMSRIVEVFPSEWRSVTLPKGMANARREVVRPVEMEIALQVAGCDTLGKDEAPAILIGKWGVKAAAVRAVL